MFVTGTDTNIGKTTVACGLAAALRARGYRVGVFKPAETGCPADGNGALIARDAALLRFFAGSDQPDEQICPYRFAEPLAPLVAARRSGTEIDAGILKQHMTAIAAAHDVTLIEGAGGLLVPITEKPAGNPRTFADLALAWRLPVVVVVGNRLGAVNHALLTVRHARDLGLDVVGYILNTLQSEADTACATNESTLSEWLGPPLGVVPFIGELTPTDACREQLAKIFADIAIPGIA